MKHLFTIVTGCFLSLQTFGQLAPSPAIMGVTPEAEAQWSKWLKNLYEPGIIMRNDSMITTEEARRVALDTAYRKIIYRPAYNWQEAQYLLKRMELKIGFWHLINLYMSDPLNKEPVLKYILSFDPLMEMDRVLISVFYTYAFLDPEAGTIQAGKPQITHPDRVEEKLSTVREMVDYVLANRKGAEGPKKN